MRPRPNPSRGPVGTVRLLVAAAAAALVAGACAPDVEVREALELTDITTGWFDAGIVDGKNKLVPAISFRLRNTSDVSINTVQVNAIFRREGEEEEWGTAFVRAIGSDGLEPGQTTAPIVLRSELGYTGEQARAEILNHSQFVDAEVEVFLKHAAAQWVSLREIPIERQLVTW